jgi:hypothetical protein
MLSFLLHNYVEVTQRKTQREGKKEEQVWGGRVYAERIATVHGLHLQTGIIHIRESLYPIYIYIHQGKRNRWWEGGNHRDRFINTSLP